MAAIGPEQEMLVETVATQEVVERGVDLETAVETEAGKFKLEETPLTETQAGQTEGETEAGEKT